jgi:hypothetical protein
MHRLLLPLLLAVACTGVEEGPHYADDDTGGGTTSDTAPVDDADDPEHAVAIDWETEMTDTLDSDDSDWYRIAGVAAGQHFRVQVVNSDENGDEDSLDTVVEVYDEALNRIAWEDDHPVGDVGTYDTVCFGFFPAAGAYYIRVLDRGNFEGAVRDVARTEYSIQILAPSSPPTEPDSLLRLSLDYSLDNDNSWYAIPVLADEAGDVDYARLVLPHDDGALTFWRAHHIESSHYQPALTLYDEEGTPVMSAPTLEETDFRQFISPPDTTWVLGISDASGVSGPAEGMWVFVADSEAGYGNTREREPNDSREGAMALTLADQYPDAGSWVADFVEGRIGAAGDEDWYSFTLESDAYVTVGFGALAYGSLLDAAVDVHGDELLLSGTAVDGVDPDLRSSGKLPAGSYAVSVRAADGATGGTGAYYRMAVHATSVPL